MSAHPVVALEGVDVLLKNMLQEALASKGTHTIEPALAKSSIGDVTQRISNIPGLREEDSARGASQNAVIETAVRNAFNTMLASRSIEEPRFVEMWNLLDIVSFLSDEDQCDPALFFWLVEELLDSQTIAGCSWVFDYLESRRDRITAKYFDKKQLAILRTCNELLRRLSRAEDTAFCGRVFIFLFQCFPLGDKSSVNLRGEYHVENITTFDTAPQAPEDTADAMEVDEDLSKAPRGPKLAEGANSSSVVSDAKSTLKSVSFDAKNAQNEKVLEPDELYPIFWTLQQYFSQPKKLFDPAQVDIFKKGIEATMLVFEKIRKDQGERGMAKVNGIPKAGIKRKRGSAGESDLANAFNPKYLTSRDLFELELSDLSFRRHIAVQALIVLDFLLSLSAKAKEKQAAITPQNKSVMYQDQLLSDEDTRWALDTKKAIADYLKKGVEGPYFHRMVETVLSRDKNWVRWKMESCPPIAKPSVTAAEFAAARASAKKVSTNKRLRPHPQASLDLKFLTNSDGDSGLERLKKPRYSVPALNDFHRMIEEDNLEIEMPTNDESAERAQLGKASKTWRALRLARTTKLRAFDKIDDSSNIDIIFKDEASEMPVENGIETVTTEEVELPEDKRPIVISGPGGVGKGTVVQMLVDRNPKIFAKKASHTTRDPREGEVNGIHYHFIDTEQYNVMRDGDQFLEFNTFNANHYGTSRKVVEKIIVEGRIPVMEMDYHGIQQLKDNGYSARYIFLSAPSTEELERRLRSRGADSEDKIVERMKIAEEEIEHAKIEGFHDCILVNDDLEKTYTAVLAFIQGTANLGEAAVANEGSAAMEVKMEDVVDENVDTSATTTALDTKDVPMSADGCAAPAEQAKEQTA